MARACLGSIDLDPASSVLANATVRAETFYTLKQDGLKQPWFGRVWLNPPYGKFGQHFVEKAVAEFLAGRIEQVVILLNVGHIATKCFNRAMLPCSYLLCTPKKRINFTSPNYITSSAPSPSVFIYIGKSPERFREFFGPLGRITSA